MPELRHLSPMTKAVLLAFALVLLGILFQQLVTLLVAILITVLIAIPLSAAATFLERFGIHRAIGALAGLLLGVAVIAGVLWLVIPPFIDQTEEFVDQVPGVIDDLQAELNDIGGADAGDEVQDFLQGYIDEPDRLIGPLSSIGLGLAALLGAIILIAITAYYIAVRPQPLVDGALALFPPERREWARGVMDRLRATWVGWMEGVLIDMLITGVLLYIGLQLIGLDYAIIFAVFSAVLVLIPYFGAILGAIPPTLFALTDSPEKAVLALAIYILVQQVESNLTIPLVMANRARLHPAVVAIGVVIIGQLFGFVGLFVAVPILSLIVILVDELWVKPLERDRAVVAATGLEPLDSEGRAMPAEREPTGTGLGSG